MLNYRNQNLNDIYDNNLFDILKNNNTNYNKLSFSKNNIKNIDKLNESLKYNSSLKKYI